MKYLVTVIAGFLLVELSSSHIIPGKLIAGSEQDVPDTHINNDTLVFANIIYRHGERDVSGSMQLTNEGKRQLYTLGEYFHRRYSRILGGTYSPEKVYTISTDYDRSIMSAQANLAGLFMPTADEIWHENIMWQPVPVHTLPREMDIIMRPKYGKRCPKYNAMYDYYIKKSPEALEMYEKYGHLFEYWAKMSGREVETIEGVFSIYKKIKSENERNVTIPDWAKEAIKPNGPMDTIAKCVYKLRGKPKLVRIRSGFLLKEMLERASEKANGTLEPDLSLYIYSAHSSTITTLLNGLGMNEKEIPPHGSAFQLELYKTYDNDHYLQLFVRRPDEEDPQPKNIPGCGVKCPMKQFYTVFDALIPTKFKTECKMPEQEI